MNAVLDQVGVVGWDEMEWYTKLGINDSNYYYYDVIIINIIRSTWYRRHDTTRHSTEGLLSLCHDIVIVEWRLVWLAELLNQSIGPV